MDEKDPELEKVRKIIRKEFSRIHQKIKLEFKRAARERDNMTRKIRGIMVDVQSIRFDTDQKSEFEPNNLRRFLIIDDEKDPNSKNDEVDENGYKLKYKKKDDDDE